MAETASFLLYLHNANYDASQWTTCFYLHHLEISVSKAPNGKLETKKKKKEETGRFEDVKALLWSGSWAAQPPGVADPVHSFSSANGVLRSAAETLADLGRQENERLNIIYI